MEASAVQGGKRRLLGRKVEVLSAWSQGLSHRLDLWPWRKHGDPFSSSLCSAFSTCELYFVMARSPFFRLPQSAEVTQQSQRVLVALLAFFLTYSACMALLQSPGKGAVSYPPQLLSPGSLATSPPAPCKCRERQGPPGSIYGQACCRLGSSSQAQSGREACMGAIAGRPRITYVIIHPHPHNEAL